MVITVKELKTKTTKLLENNYSDFSIVDYRYKKDDKENWLLFLETSKNCCLLADISDVIHMENLDVDRVADK